MSALLNRILEKHYYPDVKCPALSFRGKGFICVWGRSENTPRIVKLASEISEKDDICLACKKTRDLLERVESAERLLSEERRIQMPQCLAGGQLRESEGKLELQCMNPDYGAYKWRDVNEYCKLVRNGANCEMIRWHDITVQGPLGVSDNR